MAKALHAIDYLRNVSKHPAQAVCVVFGDEPFLKREVLGELRRGTLGEDDGAFAFTSLSGGDAQWRDVTDELDTMSMFSQGGRMVLIEDADEFVSLHRSALEEYVARPKHHGVLVLDVKKWASNTRLYKALASGGLQIECKTPGPEQLLRWLSTRSKQKHGVKLSATAAELLVDSVEPELGLLDQELARLALLVGDDGEITPELVRDHVGSWRTRKVWDMVDAATDGDARSALTQLDRLLLAGEDPIGVLAQISSTLRRFAAATQLVEQSERAKKRIPLRPILQQAGFKHFVLEKAERQLRQLGRRRARMLYRWLLEADLALKGSSSAREKKRLVLEQLLVRFSKAADPRRSLTASGAQR